MNIFSNLKTNKKVINYTEVDLFIIRAILQKEKWANITSGTPEFKRYDLNNDGVINSQDLLILRKIILGIDPPNN